MDKYIIQKQIGVGAFAQVSKAINKTTNEVVAIKKMKKKFATWEECIALNEIKSLTKLKHPNIIKLIEVIRSNDELFCVFEFCQQTLYQSYLSYKEKGIPLPEPLIKSLIYQTAQGLSFTHKHGFFHRDLKPENLLLNEDVIKIADFGLAREIRSRPPYTDYVSTRWYRAPEIMLKSTNYNSPVDIYALGCIMAELYMMSPLFSGGSEIDQLNKICSVLGTPNTSLWNDGVILAGKIHFTFPQYQPINLSSIITNTSEQAISLISEMLRWDPSKRLNITQVLQHPYFHDVIPPSINMYDGKNSAQTPAKIVKNQIPSTTKEEFQKGDFNDFQLNLKKNFPKSEQNHYNDYQNDNLNLNNHASSANESPLKLNKLKIDEANLKSSFDEFFDDETTEKNVFKKEESPTEIFSKKKKNLLADIDYSSKFLNDWEERDRSKENNNFMIPSQPLKQKSKDKIKQELPFYYQKSALDKYLDDDEFDNPSDTFSSNPLNFTKSPQKNELNIPQNNQTTLSKSIFKSKANEKSFKEIALNDLKTKPELLITKDAPDAKKGNFPKLNPVTNMKDFASNSNYLDNNQFKKLSNMYGNTNSSNQNTNIFQNKSFFTNDSAFNDLVGTQSNIYVRNNQKLLSDVNKKEKNLNFSVLQTPALEKSIKISPSIKKKDKGMDLLYRDSSPFKDERYFQSLLE